jgi:catechol 1,2-dioxygenase
MRNDEPGDPLIAELKVVDLDGNPIEGALLDTWQADNYGAYSGYHGDAPEGNLRGKMKTDENGKVVYETVRPGPYPIPDQGPTGRLLGLLGQHSWRPATCITSSRRTATRR